MERHNPKKSFTPFIIIFYKHAIDHQQDPLKNMSLKCKEATRETQAQEHKYGSNSETTQGNFCMGATEIPPVPVV